MKEALASKPSSLKERLDAVVQADLCMGCGFCSVGVKSLTQLPKLVFDPAHDSFVPPTQNLLTDTNEEVVCVGEQLDLPALSMKRFGKLPDDPLLGVYLSTGVAWTKDEKMRQRAASGGLIPAILTYLFQEKLIDVAYCVEAGADIYSARGRIIESAEELQKIHGSVYHPAHYGSELAELFRSKKRFAFVGLPCHISALEQFKTLNDSVAQNHVLSIGLFCGGINSFRGISYYLESFGVEWSSLKQIEYRVGDWPGKIRLTFKDGFQKLLPRIRGNTRWKILRYVIAFQGFWMLKRCRICPDQVSDFADIAVGDPHHPKYRQRKESGFSAVVARSSRGQKILDAMKSGGHLAWEDVDPEFIKESQGYTLDNRRHVHAYLKVNRLFGQKNPTFKTYPALEGKASPRHFIAAMVDLGKIQLRHYRFLRPLYLPWQIFEYLFLTFAPRLILQRIFKLMRNQ